MDSNSSCVIENGKREVRPAGPARNSPDAWLVGAHYFHQKTRHLAVALNRPASGDGYLFSDDGSGVFIRLPAANPTRAMLKNTQTIPSAWPNTNPPSSHKTTEMITDKTSKRTFESMTNLSNKISARARLDYWLR
ncbi:MAG TPA: hypothetical protein VIM35_03285 [Gallionella sp.]